MWFLDLKNGKGATGKGEPNQPADATLTMDSENFFAMFSGTCECNFFVCVYVYINVYDHCRMIYN